MNSTKMTRCTRKGCGQDYDPAENAANSCTYHSGGPVFHEGLKSWSCCADVNKPVLEFDEFMKILGCTKGEHIDEAPQVEAPKSSSNTSIRMTSSIAGTEVYTSGPPPSSGSTQVSAAVTPQAASSPVIEEDDLNVPVNVGTVCLHNTCGTPFISDDVNRKGDGEGTICTYHPAPPIFREGSKGYLCCKRRVLEFDEFLKIKGCKKGRHLFVRKTADSMTEEKTACRIDHYQTLTEVHVSIFAKQADQERSVINFAENEIFFDLYMPASSKRFTRTLDLFGPIDVNASTFNFFGTKVELHLKKQDTRSWTVLEKTTQDLGNISLTFGVGGRTGNDRREKCYIRRDQQGESIAAGRNVQVR